MKKIVILVAMALVAMSANAQFLDFSSNDNRLGFGVQIGQSATGTEYAKLGFGISLSAMGGYIDFLRVVPDHQYDNHVTNTIYDDSSSFNINIGYQIPILPWLRLMPLVGYCQTNYGKTDATTVNIETNEDNSQMYHDYDVTPGSRKHYYNLGLGLFVQPIRWIDLYAIGSMRGIYGGISFNLGAFAIDDD